MIGYGNSLRRDDGAGPFLAAALAERWLAAGRPARHLAVHQLVPELAEEIARPAVAAVLFVDAAIDARAPQFQGAPHAISRVEPLAPSPSVGHHLDPATLLLYADRLLGRCPPAWLLTVPGQDFAFGEGFSPAVRAAIDHILGRAAEVWAAVYVK